MLHVLLATRLSYRRVPMQCARLGQLYPTLQRQLSDTSSMIYTSKKDHRRKVYKRLKKIVRDELESTFKASNRDKLKLLDDKLQLKMKYNPKIVGDFNEFGINKSQTQILHDKFPHCKLPTPTQRKLLSVLNSNISCHVRPPLAQGTSTGLLLYAFNLKRPSKTSVTSLIVVPTTQLLKQYMSWSERLLDGYPYDANTVVQCIYRDANTEIETQQESLLKSKPPHILITTPQRLLDLISEHLEDLNYFQLDRLKFICLDHADTMFETSNDRHESPVMVLTKYLHQLRSTVVNNPLLQTCFISNLDLTDKLPELVRQNGWGEGRPIVNIGIPVVQKGEMVPRLRVPTNVDIGSVVVDQEGDFADVSLMKIPTGMAAMREIQSDLALEFDVNYSNYRNRSKDKLPLNLINQLPKLIQKLQWQKEKVLLIIPEGVSQPKLIQQLLEHQLYAQTTIDQQFFINSNREFDQHNGQFMITTSGQITGICLPQCERVITLGVDSVKDYKELITVASRCRYEKSGLINEGKFVTYLAAQRLPDTELSKLVMLYDQLQLEVMERYALQRMILQSGLPGLCSVVDKIEQIDLKKFANLINE